jgi:hypothetical protein
MQYKLSCKVKDIDYNIIVKVDIVLEVKLELTWWLAILLAIFVVLGKVLKSRLIDVVML